MAKRRSSKKKVLRGKNAKIAAKMAGHRKTRQAGSAMRRLIQSEIAREIENKDTQSYNLQKTLVGVASPTFQDNIIQVGPNNNATEPLLIAQGVGVNSRIGNKIKTKYMMLKGTLTPLPYDGTTNAQPTPVQVRLVLFYDKQNPSGEPQPSTNFFQYAGANQGFLNDLTDLWRPINKDRYRILASRTFKLGYAENTALGAVTTYANMANNDFKMNHNFRVNLTKMYPKIVKFDENNGDPTTRSLWMMFYYVSATGGAIAANQNLVNVQWMVDYKYEDA